MSKRYHPESLIQQSIIEWRDLNVRRHSAIRWLHAIPNSSGGGAPIHIAARWKREGVTAGVFDLFLPYPGRGYHGLYIEVKSAMGKLSKSQIEFSEFLAAAGYKFLVARDLYDAVDEICWHLGLPNWH